jgi:hypothetical protein
VTTCEACRSAVRSGELVIPIARFMLGFAPRARGEIARAQESLVPTDAVVHLRCMVAMFLPNAGTPSLASNLHDFIQREGP